MKLEDAIALLHKCRQRMDALYQKPVFDEWAVVTFAPDGKTDIRHYDGPRASTFSENFHRDSRPLMVEMSGKNYEVGDFEFADAAVGARFDACVCMGEKTYLFCNNTYGSMAQLRVDPRWRQAQAPFVDLTERFRTSPLA